MKKVSHTVFDRTRSNDLAIEIGVRIVLFIIFIITDDAIPFKRQIQPEEVWLYKFPHNEDTIGVKTVHFWNIVMSLFVVWVVYKLNRNRNEAVSCLLGVSMSILLSITIANFVKLVVGRPRPDFFERCYSGTDMPLDLEELALAICPGPKDVVLQGYKSFPSGHSALAFGGMAYLSFYLAWSLKLFQQPQLRLSVLRMLAFLTPLILATLIAASRTCDYHHHWQDVTVGSLLGISISYICYRQGFPSFLDRDKKSDNIIQLSPPTRDFTPLSGVQTF